MSLLGWIVGAAVVSAIAGSSKIEDDDGTYEATQQELESFRRPSNGFFEDAQNQKDWDDGDYTAWYR